MTFEQVERCKDRTVEIIYCSASGEFTKRRIRVVGVTEQQLYEYCYLEDNPDQFLIDRVLAWHLLHHNFKGKTHQQHATKKHDKIEGEGEGIS